jgi:hypothetical protein
MLGIFSHLGFRVSFDFQLGLCYFNQSISISFIVWFCWDFCNLLCEFLLIWNGGCDISQKVVELGYRSWPCSWVTY